MFDIAGNTLANAITATSSGATVNLASTDPLTVSGSLSGNMDLTVSGSAIIANNSGLFGSTTVENGGTLQMGTTQTAASLSLNSLVVAGGGTLNVINVSGSLVGVSGGAAAAGNAPGLVVVNSTGNVTFQGTLTDGAAPLSLHQVGSSHHDDLANASYSGQTLVSAGTLIVFGGETISGASLQSVSRAARLKLMARPPQAQ